MLQLPEPVYLQLRRHCEEAYPHECCGVLVGRFAATGKSVAVAIPVHNVSSVNTRHHYQIDPAEMIRVMREAHLAGREVVGFYHSHPDHPAQWSTKDLSEAHWLGCSYAITAVAEGVAGDTRSFHLAGSLEEDKRFELEEIHLLKAGLGPEL